MNPSTLVRYSSILPTKSWTASFTRYRITNWLYLSGMSWRYPIWTLIAWSWWLSWSKSTFPSSETSGRVLLSSSLWVSTFQTSMWLRSSSNRSISWFRNTKTMTIGSANLNFGIRRFSLIPTMALIAIKFSMKVCTKLGTIIWQNSTKWT